MPIQSRLSEGAFTPEQVRVIVDAFYGPWAALQAEHSYPSQRFAETARDLLAKRIIDRR
jgi:hypothetical protein